ncbi:hypothetical protein [Streptomyces carpaticus]|uniref:hypothetical protein n=1 Tax=Streptomyces carpaticus TaxID=285558 RepID=UPI0031F770A3
MQYNQSPSAQYVLTDQLPEGELVLPVDSEQGTVMLVREGHMSPELVEVVNRHLASMTRTGLWKRGPKPEGA